MITSIKLKLVGAMLFASLASTTLAWNYASPTWMCSWKAQRNGSAWYLTAGSGVNVKVYNNLSACDNGNCPTGAGANVCNDWTGYEWQPNQRLVQGFVTTGHTAVLGYPIGLPQ